MDSGYTNALALRRRLEAEVDTLENSLQAARSQLRKVIEFIETWEQYAALDVSAGALEPPEGGATQDTSHPRGANPSKEQVAEVAVEVLKRVGRPLSRSDLFEAVKLAGLDIRGKDPIVNFSTMLWRMKDVVRSVPGAGYWPTDLPLPNKEGIMVGEPKRSDAKDDPGKLFD